MHIFMRQPNKETIKILDDKSNKILERQPISTTRVFCCYSTYKVPLYHNNHTIGNGLLL